MPAFSTAPKLPVCGAPRRDRVSRRSRRPRAQRRWLRAAHSKKCGAPAVASSRMLRPSSVFCARRLVDSPGCFLGVFGPGMLQEESYLTFEIRSNGAVPVISAIAQCLLNGRPLLISVGKPHLPDRCTAKEGSAGKHLGGVRRDATGSYPGPRSASFYRFIGMSRKAVTGRQPAGDARPRCLSRALAQGRTRQRPLSGWSS